MGITTAYDLPILTTETLDPWLEEQGLIWPDIRPPVLLKEWVAEKGRSDEEVEIARRFAPGVEVLEQKRPDSTTYAHFIVDEGRGTLIFCLLPNPIAEEDPFVAFVAEPKPWGVSIMPPGARWDNKGEGLQECAIREFAEETGILLDGVKPLAGGRATPYNRRLGKRGDGTFWFLGIPKEPVQVQPMKRDHSEPVRPFLMTLSEWSALCDEGGSKHEHGVVEACGPAITLLALRALGIHV